MKSQLTPTPWRAGRPGTVVADSEIGTHSDPYSVKYYGGCLIAESIATQANADRIAAAVNACEGISIEALNDGVVSNLLEALVRLREWVRNPGADDSPENEAVIDEAEAAIAKAKGESDV